MNNTLNITTTNFGENSDKFVLNSPFLYLDFRDGVGMRKISYLMPEITFSATTKYAVFKTGIPKTEIRRDIIDQEFMFECILKQFQKETLALTMQRRVDITDSDYDRVIIGSDVPAPVFPSAVIVSKTVDGADLRLWIRRLQITAEDFKAVFGGDDYTNIPFKGTAIVDTDPLTNQPTWPYNPAYPTQDNIAFWSWVDSES